jgi:NTP pyrophosphatase (non-canonical NTP hydrolase)
MNELLYKNDVLKSILDVGGCDATDEWSNGYDNGVSDAYEAVLELKANEDPRLVEIASYYGFTSQADMLTEESAEFTVALNKLRRGHADAYEHIKEEVADVLVIAYQLRHLLGAEAIDMIIDEKIERQLGRIREEKGEKI